MDRADTPPADRARLDPALAARWDAEGEPGVRVFAGAARCFFRLAHSRVPAAGLPDGLWVTTLGQYTEDGRLQPIWGRGASALNYVTFVTRHLGRDPLGRAIVHEFAEARTGCNDRETAWELHHAALARWANEDPPRGGRQAAPDQVPATTNEETAP
jgi:hypothetical protein